MGKLVFVVDDDPALARLVSLSLQIEGFQVRSFTSALEALARLADDSQAFPQAIVLDLNMPEMDGRQFYQFAREAGYTNPVLILSAFGAKQAQKELGAEASLPKPFDPQDVAEKLRALTPNE